MRIYWHTRSSLLFDCLISGSLNSKANGGNSYDFEAAQALKTRYEVLPVEEAVQRENESILGYWRRNSKIHQYNKSIHVLEPYAIAFGRLPNSSKSVGIIHHIDTVTAARSIKHRIFFLLLFRKLKRLDRVITVSQVWKNFLLEKGCKNVDIIYNSFIPSNYSFKKDDLANFKKSLGIDDSKRLIYIGNAGNGKGVHYVYHELSDQGYELVMTGAKNAAQDLPVKYFNLDALSYRKLIASCDVVLAMSDMVEGWNRIAHEALLSKVPVIGSGSGGMQELLDKSGQISCHKGDNLSEKVIQVLEQKVQLGEKGYRFVKQFDEDYFRKSWIEVINKLNQSS
jgi:glycosyltransferase involved in cell wall biosynthesis